MKTGSLLFAMVLLIVLAIPLFADQALVNPVSEFSAISIINSQEEVVNRDVTAPIYEILAVKPAEIKQSWLPLYSVRSKGNIANTIKCSNPRVNVRNNIRRRIRSPA